MASTTQQRRSKRPKRYADTQEFGAMVERMLRAYGARVAKADQEDLRQLLALQELLHEVTVEAVAGMRSEGSAYSWADIGEVAGITRQAAQQRWGR